MPRYLVVANQSLDNDEPLGPLRERVAAAPLPVAPVPAQGRVSPRRPNRGAGSILEVA
jgi:hypothetical protein